MPLFVPEKILVGYQKRPDTYTGNLAFIVYYNEKNEVQNKGSWDSWIEKSLGSNEFNNKPTEGFVINKKVGATNYSGWYRQPKVRVYDPRGFEFEISIENLLMILENCNSIKGKGLEGEFVYSWDKKTLVLLPVSSTIHSQSSVYTGARKKSIHKSDMKPGFSYYNRRGELLVYIGFLEYYEDYKLLDKKRHVFLGPRGQYVQKPSLSSIVAEHGQTHDPDTLLCEFLKTKNGSAPSGLEIAKISRDDYDELMDKNGKYGTIYGSAYVSEDHGKKTFVVFDRLYNGICEIRNVYESPSKSRYVGLRIKKGDIFFKDGVSLRCCDNIDDRLIVVLKSGEKILMETGETVTDIVQ